MLALACVCEQTMPSKSQGSIGDKQANPSKPTNCLPRQENQAPSNALKACVWIYLAGCRGSRARPICCLASVSSRSTLGCPSFQPPQSKAACLYRRLPTNEADTYTGKNHIKKGHPFVRTPSSPSPRLRRGRFANIKKRKRANARCLVCLSSRLFLLCFPSAQTSPPQCISNTDCPSLPP